MEMSIHPMDARWETLAKNQYRQAYPELLSVFRHILGRSFLRNHWIPDPLALDYMTKILIRFLPMNSGKRQIEEALAHWETEVDDPRDLIRYYETVGELILWWSGVFHRQVFQAEGKRSYEIAYERLQDIEAPAHRFILTSPGDQEKLGSKRLKVNKMFSEQFEYYQEVLQEADLLEDPAFRRFRDLFMTDDFSIN